MPYNIGIIKPHHPDAVKDDEHELVVTSFTGPEVAGDHRWLQLSIGTEFIRLSIPQIHALLILCEQRMQGTDTEMIIL